MFHSLAEAKAGIEHDPVAVNARGHASRGALREKSRHVGNDVLVARAVLHRRRFALHVHEADRGAAL